MFDFVKLQNIAFWTKFYFDMSNFCMCMKSVYHETRQRPDLQNRMHFHSEISIYLYTGMRKTTRTFTRSNNMKLLYQTGYTLHYNVYIKRYYEARI